MAQEDVTKQCSQCGEIKAGVCFSPNTTSPDGLRSNCKECQSRVRAPSAAGSPRSRGVKVASTLSRIQSWDDRTCAHSDRSLDRNPSPACCIDPHHVLPRRRRRVAGGRGLLRKSLWTMRRQQNGSNTRCVAATEARGRDLFATRHQHAVRPREASAQWPTTLHCLSRQISCRLTLVKTLLGGLLHCSLPTL